MGHRYQAIQWNSQKKRYDLLIFGWLLVYFITFVLLSLFMFPDITIETLIIRAFGIAAIILLHFVLAIGPLARIDTRFNILLYNRRHLGVTMFLMAAVHGIFSIIQFHGFGNEMPIISIFTSNTNYASFQDFPFQTLGFLALVILFLMAATSHDFLVEESWACILEINAYAGVLGLYADHLACFTWCNSARIILDLSDLADDRSDVFRCIAYCSIQKKSAKKA